VKITVASGISSRGDRQDNPDPDRDKMQNLTTESQELTASGYTEHQIDLDRSGPRTCRWKPNPNLKPARACVRGVI
jgi:hypothetical protein